jgi:DNA invertase Pin-like site-specific DNA recombinase
VEAGDVEQGHVVLLESFDRLNRQVPLDALAPFTSIINAGITIVTLLDQQVFTRASLSADGGIKLLMSLLVMVRAHEESATKSRRVSAAWDKKRRNAANSKLTKTCPAWLRLKSDRTEFEVIEERAEIVRRIFRETAEGIGKATIAARLNAAGVPTFRGGNGWHASYIQKLVASDAVLGFYRPHVLEGGRRKPWGEPVPDYFPAIMGLSLAGRARAGVVARRYGASGRKGRTFTNLLTGSAYCGACGATMTLVAKSPGEDYLGCSGARRQRRCTSRTLFNYHEVERQALGAIECFSVDAAAIRDDLAVAIELRSRLIEDVEVLSRRLKRLLEAFGSDDAPEIADTIHSVRRRRDEVQSQLKAAGYRIALLTHSPGLQAAQQLLRELRPQFALADDMARYAARAGVFQIFRSLQVKLFLFPETRTGTLALQGHGSSVTFNCKPARRAVQARSRNGRFANGSGPTPAPG